jgi:hypothetical protein
MIQLMARRHKLGILLSPRRIPILELYLAVDMQELKLLTTRMIVCMATGDHVRDHVEEHKHFLLLHKHMEEVENAKQEPKLVHMVVSTEAEVDVRVQMIGVEEIRYTSIDTVLIVGIQVYNISTFLVMGNHTITTIIHVLMGEIWNQDMVRIPDGMMKVAEMLYFWTDTV